MGLGEIGNPQPMNIVVNAQIEADFLANATEADMRRLYYGELSTLPIRAIEQRKANEDPMRNFSGWRSGDGS